ncbi:MAG TPA: flagellar biosynthetic protein FliR [Tepidisphaeraceae bacterium]|nr:flagellar biosynthetic protein FliR [Tepidisphaeraceae bacterium]
MNSLSDILNIVPVYVLVLCRIAGMMVFAPLLGSTRIPKRVKAMIACVLAFTVASTMSPAVRPVQGIIQLSFGMAGEIIIGLLMGTVLSFTFISAQWAGEIIGQQLGLNISETLDPEFGVRGTIMSDLYFQVTMVIFLLIGGHRAILMGVRQSFDTLPLLSGGMTGPMLGWMIDLFQASTTLALQLAAPVLVTLMITDLALGFVGKTMPQLNVMSAGISIRALVGLTVIIVGIGLTDSVIRQAVQEDMINVYQGWLHLRPLGGM